MCAVRMFHDCAPWRPRVVLHDFDTPKGDVLVDYIMFEKTGRIDYTFNATEAQVHSTATQDRLLSKLNAATRCAGRMYPTSPINRTAACWRGLCIVLWHRF